VRVRLKFDYVPEIAQLPWELIFVPSLGGFLGRQTKTTIVRYQEPVVSWEKQKRSDPFRVLVVFALPEKKEIQIPELNLAKEKDAIQKQFSNNKNVEVEFLTGRRAAKEIGTKTNSGDMLEQISACLSAGIQDKGWDVVHFSGHAGEVKRPGKTQTDIALWLENESGELRALTGEKLESILVGLPTEKRPKLIVLNACKTAQSVNSLVKFVLSSGVSAVVGMQWSVREMPALAFSKQFYSVITRHGQVDYAVALARSNAFSVSKNTQDWAAPLLVMQSEDGVIYKHR
jgi:CHAT domain-containing protein